MARLIDAEALAAEMYKHHVHDDEELELLVYLADAEKVISNAPTVDAVPVVHARWVKMTGMMPPEYHGHYMCSNCEWHMKGLRNSWTREEELLYCPGCGAIMDGGNTDESK